MHSVVFWYGIRLIFALQILAKMEVLACQMDFVCATKISRAIFVKLQFHRVESTKIIAKMDNATYFWVFVPVRF